MDVLNFFNVFKEQENLADAEERNEQLVKAKQELENQVSDVFFYFLYLSKMKE